MSVDASADAGQERMSFLAHLEELRIRLFYTLTGLVLGSCLCYHFAAELFDLLAVPLRQYASLSQLVGLSPAEAFVVKLKVGLLAGLIVSLPFSFYQLWRFISPGLHKDEKRFVLPFVISSTLFCVFGMAFCYYAVLPVAFRFFLEEYQSIQAAANIRIEEYLSFVMSSLLIFGFVFELPVFTYFLVRFGFLTERWLIKQRKIMIVGAFVVGGVFSPPDIISQCLLAGPLLILYVLCIGIAHYVELMQPRPSSVTR